MENQTATLEVAGLRPGEGCRQAAKWAAVVDDVLVPMPRRNVQVSVLAAQASIPAGYVLVRDHNSPDDDVLPDDGEDDRAAGNVVYRLERCAVQLRGGCRDRPTLAFVLDDRFEITTRPDQTGRTLRELLSVPLHARIYRDAEGRADEEVPSVAGARFEDGPVFYSREVRAELAITVNSRLFTEHDGVKPAMSGLEVAALAYPENPASTRVYLVSDRNREVDLGETLHIRGCEVFDVVRREVTGGFERSRLDREIGALRVGGLEVTLVESPRALVYHGLRTGQGAPVGTTDVLVPIPGAYPGQMIDWAYLPEGSPLVGRVKGSPQEHRLSALGRVWRQISYHPHNGGGGPKWNPTVHGFHTYLGEVISWLRNI
jgi:hypothetical protein